MLAALGGLFVVLVCVDMGVKQYVEDFFAQGEDRETRVSRLVLRKVYNRGFLLNTLESYPMVVKGASVVVGAILAVYDGYLVLRKGRWLQKLGMVFVSAGAFSNTYDRLLRGKVIDYIGVRSKNGFLSKVTANLADVYLAAGAVLVSVGSVLRGIFSK